ncbi:hypothetical protein [uncultured Methanoregula sp.]|uniref:hypothetical protein n=1 Tax=uncultured Methanoregula sp. TaxID=1005933 RepID=UPI002AAC305A|nr:hypothetical protein [uncultured Methanoregula sp.]
MTRGRRPYMALQEAARIAEMRGEVRHFMHGPDMICNFVIYPPGSVAHVRIKRVRRLRCTRESLEREAAEELAILRSIASLPGISRELWTCSPKGSCRFFRVLDTSLVEIGRDGLLLLSSQENIAEKTVTPIRVTGLSVGEKDPSEHGGNGENRKDNLTSFRKTGLKLVESRKREREGSTEKVPNSQNRVLWGDKYGSIGPGFIFSPRR